jgi:F-type H+-transporting ATPase subunit gamma
MRQLNEISAELESMKTIVKLTNAFEGIASMRIAQVKDQVLSSEEFFAELWRIYSQIRVDELFHFGRGLSVSNVIEKELVVLITSEGGFSGDIDMKLLQEALKNYDSKKQDIVVVGHHGATQLTQMDIDYVKILKMPIQDRNINVIPIISEVQKYASTVVYYQNYVSLSMQKIKKIKLSTAVAERGKNIKPGDKEITEQNYIFEPSAYEVVDHLERSMMQITLSEVILESKLAQYASRFRAMTLAHDKADENFSDLTHVYAKIKRYAKDERIKEVVNGLRKASL